MGRKSSRWPHPTSPARGATPARRGITDTVSPMRQFLIEWIMDSNNKTYRPTELGPWLFGGISSKEPEEGEEEKQQENTHLHRRTQTRLPRLVNQDRRSHEGKLEKHAIKMSHHSLQLSKEVLKETVFTSRYGAMNGTFVPIRKSKEKDKRLSEYNQSYFKADDENREIKTIDAAKLSREVSTVQLGNAILGHRLVRGGTKRLMNEEAAKKRGILQFIRDITRNNQFMEYYVSNKRNGKVSRRPLG